MKPTEFKAPEQRNKIKKRTDSQKKRIKMKKRKYK